MWEILAPTTGAPLEGGQRGGPVACPPPVGTGRETISVVEAGGTGPCQCVKSYKGSGWHTKGMVGNKCTVWLSQSEQDETGMVLGRE